MKIVLNDAFFDKKTADFLYKITSEKFTYLFYYIFGLKS